MDTNVVLYAYDRSEDAKREIARSILSSALGSSGSERFVISTQVLAEFFSAATRRLDPPLPTEEATAAVRALTKMTVIGADAGFVRTAIDLAVERRISSWDALIVRAAQVGRCERLLTEDLQEGATFGAVRIEDPFRAPSPANGGSRSS